MSGGGSRPADRDGVKIDIQQCTEYEAVIWPERSTAFKPNHKLSMGARDTCV